MTWFDGVVVLAVVGLVLFQMRQEAGKGLLDTVATLASAHFSLLIAAPLGAMLGVKANPALGYSPLVLGLCFGVMVGLGMLGGRLLHRQTRWTMDQFDPVFGVMFGVMIAVAAGHVTMEVYAGAAMGPHGHLPGYLSHSVFAGELRTFHTYHYVIDTFHSYQYGN